MISAASLAASLKDKRAPDIDGGGLAAADKFLFLNRDISATVMGDEQVSSSFQPFSQENLSVRMLKTS